MEDTAIVRKAQSAGGPDGSPEVDQGRPTVSSEPWLGLKDFMKRVPIVRSLDLLSGGDKGDGKEKLEVGDGESKSTAVLAETAARVDKLLDEVEEEFRDAEAASIRGVDSGETGELSAAEEGTPSLLLAAEATDVSSEEKLEEMRQELERLVKLLRASIDSKTAGFKRINKEWNEALKELRRAFKKAEKFHKRYRKTMARLEKMGYIIPPAPQPQEAPHRRASLDAVTPSAETRTSDMSLVMELRRAASSLYQIQTADGVSGSGETADKLPSAEGRTPSLPTVPEPTAVSSEENLEEMRQELERLVKLMRASIDSKTAGFKRINKEWGEALKELRRAFKKAEKFHKRYRKTMALLEKMGYIIPPAPQPQEAPHRRRASMDATTSLAETCTSDTSLVIELRRAVSSLYGIQSVDGVSAMSTDTDKQRSTAAEGASATSADRVSAMSDDIDRLSFATARENPHFYDDPDNLWLTWPWMFSKSGSAAKDDSMRSDTTSLSSTDSFATAVSELMDLDDHHGESTAQDQASEVILQSSASAQKKSKLQRLKKWIQRKGRSFCNKIRCR